MVFLCVLCAGSRRVGNGIYGVEWLCVERIFGDVGGWCRREGELVVGRGRGWSMRRRG